MLHLVNLFRNQCTSLKVTLNGVMKLQVQRGIVQKVTPPKSHTECSDVVAIYAQTLPTAGPPSLKIPINDFH